MAVPLSELGLRPDEAVQVTLGSLGKEENDSNPLLLARHLYCFVPLPLLDAAKEAVVRKTTGADPKMVVRRNPFDPDDRSESTELEQRHGYTPVNLAHMASGVSSLLKEAPGPISFLNIKPRPRLVRNEW